MEHKIDIETWPRKAQYHLFKEMDYPHFNVCANVDITKMYDHIHGTDISFNKAMIYITTKVANEIKEFRYRLRRNDVICHEVIHPSYTILTQPEVFSFCSVEYNEDYDAFNSHSNEREKALKGKVDLQDEPSKDNRLYITSLPWVSFTSISHPIDIKSLDSIPRIAWGKFFLDHDKRMMPLSVQVNHVLMDGYHVGKYFERFQEVLDSPEEIF